MRHVVIGAGGFVGRRLVEELRRAGEPVLAFGHGVEETGDGTALPGDLCREEDLARLALGPDDTVHLLASRHFGNGVPKAGRDAWFDAVNVEGTRRVLAAMARGGARRLVFFSTDMTYGLPQRLPVATDHPQRPLGPYGRSKLEAETAIRRAAADGLRATIVRPRLITGPGRLGTLATLFGLIRRGWPVPMIGGGGNRYQMVSVDDCVRAAMRIAAAGCPPVAVNLGSANPRTAREILRAVIRHAGSRSVLVPTPAPLVKAVLAGLDRAGRTVMHPEQYLGADADFHFDMAETRALLGWVPEDDDVAVMTRAYDAFARTAAP